jgi:uncharacterized protein (TIGR03435 family)
VGPSWLDDEKFEVVARLPEGTTREQLKVMEQNMLAERFQLVVRREKQDVRGYELVVEKEGAKLKPTVAPSTDSGPPAAPARRTSLVSAGSGLEFQAFNKAIEGLTSLIASMLNKPVRNSTGLTGRYDFTIRYIPIGWLMASARAGTTAAGSSDPTDVIRAADPAGDAIFEALPKQLGLRLRSTNVSVDVLRIESARKLPTEN